ncbi:MAG: putative salt-induced outer membrane protein YdiY [Planctomycetota bacterium]|jgi:putative salt-induced outer membrane protein YdiY
MEESPEASTPPPRDGASVPLDDDSDWIELASGEWLRGKLVRVRKGKVTFDSDKLDEQVLDWVDVQRVVSAGKKVVLTEDGRLFQGVVTADGDSLWIDGEKTVQLPRSEVLSVLALNGERVSNWSNKVSLGATFRSGNTDQVDYSTLLRVSRETARTRWTNKYIGAISNVSDEETANNHRVNSQFDIYLTKRAFLTAPGVDVYRDRFQNIALRLTPYVALGYEVLDTDKQSCSVSLGPAFRYQRTDSAQPGEDPVQTSAAVVFSSRYGWAITNHVDLEFNYDLTAPVPDTNRFNHNMFLSLAVDLPGDLHLDFAILWDRANDPQLDGDGVRPEADDLRTTIGLGWSF